MKAPKQIPLKDIVFRKDNRDCIDQVKLAGLKDSIIEHGVLEPILVREAKKGKHEVICGERRVRACRLIDPDGHIPAVIMTCTDEQAEAICLVENVQRDDLTPYEEARRVARLKELHPEDRLEDLALKVGKPATWVAQRLSISKLLPALRELVEAQAWPIRQITLLARLSPELQEEMFAKIKQGQKSSWGQWMVEGDDGRRKPGAPAIHTLKSYLENYQRLLTTARWRKDDATLVPAAGACNECPKRSSQQGLLFQGEGDDPKHDRCLDPKCWQAKSQALVMLSIEKLKRINNAEPVYLGPSDAKMPEGMPGIVKPHWNFNLVKKSDKGAIPAVFVAGDRAGETCYVKAYGSAERQQTSRRRVNQETGKSEGPSNSERLIALSNKRQARAIELWQDSLAGMAPNLDTVLRLAITYSTTWPDRYGGIDHIKSYRKLPKATVDLTAVLWQCVHPKMVDELILTGSITQQIVSLMTEVNHQITALAEEKTWDKCYAQAVKEIPMSKTLVKAGVADPDLEPTK